MRKILSVVLLLAVAFSLPLMAAGTVVVTKTEYPGLRSSNVVRYAIAWTCTAGGAVSANAFSTVKGKMLSYKFVPGTAADQPTDLYDVTLNDSDAVDLLGGGGANLSNATSKLTVLTTPVYLDGTQTLDLVVANAGNAKKGTVYIWIEQ